MLTAVASWLVKLPSSQVRLPFPTGNMPTTLGSRRWTGVWLQAQKKNPPQSKLTLSRFAKYRG